MSKKIKQLVFSKERELDWREVKAPTISDRTSALVRPIAVARSDSDAIALCSTHSSALNLKNLKQDAITGLAKRIHLDRYTAAPSVGQQCIAQIVETGPDVSGLRKGMRVVVGAKLSCGSCKPCLDGLTALCSTYDSDDRYGTLDRPSPHGGLVSDLVLVPYASRMLVPLPDSLDSVLLASAGSDLGDAWCSVMPHLQGQKKRRVLFLGGAARSTTLYAVALTASLGNITMDYLDQSAERVGIAMKLGANAQLLNPRRHQGSYDLIVSGNTEPGIVRYMLPLLATGGSYVQLQPMLLKTEKIPLDQLYYKNLTLAIRQSHILANLRPMLDYLQTRQTDLKPINTHLAEFDAAIENFAKNTTKVVLHRAALHN